MYTKKISASLKNLVIFTSDVKSTSKFFSNVLGLSIVKQAQQYTELKDTNNNKIWLKEPFRDDLHHSGYSSPILNFEINNMDNVLKEAINHGAKLDGELYECNKAKIACIQFPSGPIISLMENKQNISKS